jgi:hypothetical protein
MAIDFTVPTAFLEGRSAMIMGLFTNAQKDEFLAAECQKPVSGFLLAVRALFFDVSKANLHVMTVSDAKSDFVWIYDKKAGDWRRYFAKIIVPELLRSFALFKKSHVEKTCKQRAITVEGHVFEYERVAHEAARIYGIFHEDMAREGLMEIADESLDMVADTHDTTRAALKKDLKMRSFEPLDLSVVPLPYVPLHHRGSLDVAVIPYSESCEYNTSFLTLEDFAEVFRSQQQGFARLLRLVHFTESHPENHNQLMLDTDDSDVKCFNGQSLVYKRGELLPVDTIRRTRALVQRYAAEHDAELRAAMDFRTFAEGESFLDNADLDDTLFELVMGVYDEGKQVVRKTLGPILE